jgi:drug/metabolite transporter (DMT)-like permease
MSLGSHVLAVVCVALIASGQIFFKYAANALRHSGSYLDTGVLSFVLVALVIYGGATVLWIALLQHVPLSRLYPYMALSFVLVPLAGWLLFQEQIPLGQIAGLALIVAGLLTIAAS